MEDEKILPEPQQLCEGGCGTEGNNTLCVESSTKRWCGASSCAVKLINESRKA